MDPVPWSHTWLRVDLRDVSMSYVCTAVLCMVVHTIFIIEKSTALSTEERVTHCVLCT